MRSVRGLLFVFMFSGCSAADLDGTRPSLAVRIKVHYDRAGFSCPVVTGISALPLGVLLGSELSLEGHESAEGDSYRWAGEGGEFSTPDQTTTLFLCSEPGPHTLTFAVLTEHCNTSSASVEVYCEQP